MTTRRTKIWTPDGSSSLEPERDPLVEQLTDEQVYHLLFLFAGLAVLGSDPQIGDAEFRVGIKQLLREVVYSLGEDLTSAIIQMTMQAAWESAPKEAPAPSEGLTQLTRESQEAGLYEPTPPASPETPAPASPPTA